jgi:hypothetical protein
VETNLEPVSQPENNAGDQVGNGVDFPRETTPFKSFDSKRNLCAEQLVARAESAAVRSEQPAYPQLGGGFYQGPWVRDDRPTDLAEIDSQDAELSQWALANGFFVKVDEVRRLATLANKVRKGQEHDVWEFHESNPKVVIRRTRGGGYGLRDRAPSEYFDRWRISNAAFPDTAVTLIGYTKDSRGNGVILTAQRYFEGMKRDQKAIDAAFGKLGYERMKGGEPSYRHPETKVEIYDAKPDNIIFDKAGNMMPFDVWINDPYNHFELAESHSGEAPDANPSTGTP